uniref:FAR1 domain-containing protein n=1 Tax=Globisporangium ultimum (strain ATCC 200006 / CBS 805.95 / DAOM BR144) TaxID=431595 RepID=K3WY66_GLOUD
MGEKYAFESFPDRFPSWEALDAYMEEFKEDSYQMFGVRTSVPVRLRNQRIANRARPNADKSFNEPLPESWRFYNRIYTCTHSTRFQGARGKKGLRAHGAVRDTGCTARIGATLKVDVPTRLFYISVRVDGFHNHPCDKERYYGYAENRSIKDPALAQKLLELRERGVTVAEIHRRIAKLVAESGGEGGVPTRADLHNTISRVKAAKQAETGVTSEPQRHARTEEEDVSGEEEDHDDDNDEAIEPEGRERRESSSKKRKADELASLDDDLKGFVRMRKPETPANLFQLEALLDTSYSYHLIHTQIERVAIARVQALLRSISGFVHEIVPLTASETSEDVDFLLPQYVIYGCENGIVTYCRYHGAHPSSVGVKLPVIRQFSSDAPTLATVSSRQLRVMKQIHLARQNIREVNYMIEWLQNTAKLQL